MFLAGSGAGLACRDKKMKERLTLLETHRLGDAVMALPMVWGAREAGWQVTAAAPPGTADVFRLVLPDAHVLALPPSGRSAALRAARQRWETDTAVCAWADPRAQACLVRAGYDRRVGFPVVPGNLFAREAALLPPRPGLVRVVAASLSMALGPLLTDELYRTGREQHHAEDWRQVADRLGVTARLPQDWAGPVEEQGGWLVHPGAGSPWKLWAEERWLGVLGMMAREGFPPNVVEGPGVPRLGWEGPRVICQTVRDLTDEVRRARGVVCLDSFVAHLAASMGKRVVVLFGGMNPCWFAPRGEWVRVVTTPARWPLVRGDLPGRGGTLLHEVEPERVVQAVRELG